MYYLPIPFVHKKRGRYKIELRYLEDKQIKLSGLVAKLDGSEIIKSEKQGDITDIESIGNSLAELLLERGADVILKELTN